MSAARLAAGVTVLTIAIHAAAAEPVGKAGTHKRVVAAIGSEARSCGVFPGHPYHDARSLTKDQSELVSRCADAARQAAQPWFFFVEGSAIDSWVATGLMGNRKGEVKVFWYDSAPCGGSHCGESFEVYRCPVLGQGEPVDPLRPCQDHKMPQPSFRR